MRRSRSLFAAAALAGLMAVTPAAADSAGGRLLAGHGEIVGSVSVMETPNGLIVSIEGSGLPPGAHGFHIHETGNCTAVDFSSAGGHLNPDGKGHGMNSAEGRHLGDMPNVYAGSDGVLRADAFVAGASLSDLLDDDGAAVVLHAGPDDYASQPAGAAGPRIACGVIKAEKMKDE